MQVLNTVSHCPGEITRMLSLYNHHTRTKKKKKQHSQIQTAPPERVETLVKLREGFMKNVQRQSEAPAG